MVHSRQNEVQATMSQTSARINRQKKMRFLVLEALYNLADASTRTKIHTSVVHGASGLELGDVVKALDYLHAQGYIATEQQVYRLENLGVSAIEMAYDDEGYDAFDFLSIKKMSKIELNSGSGNAPALSEDK